MDEREPEGWVQQSVARQSSGGEEQNKRGKLEGQAAWVRSAGCVVMATAAGLLPRGGQAYCRAMPKAVPGFNDFLDFAFSSAVAATGAFSCRGGEQTNKHGWACQSSSAAPPEAP